MQRSELIHVKPGSIIKWRVGADSTTPPGVGLERVGLVSRNHPVGMGLHTEDQHAFFYVRGPRSDYPPHEHIFYAVPYNNPTIEVVHLSAKDIENNI